jgi:hypothetical protein
LEASRRCFRLHVIAPGRHKRQVFVKSVAKAKPEQNVNVLTKL